MQSYALTQKHLLTHIQETHYFICREISIEEATQ